jgi:alkaline phosphatase D
VVVLSGDNHNTFAGTLAPEHPERPRDGVAVEFSIAGISSPSIFEAFAGAIAADDPMRALVVFDGTRFGGADARCPALNVTLRHGVQSTLVLQGTGDPARARAATNPRQNPHLAYMDTTANGIGVIALDATGCRTALWTFPPPVSTRFERLRVATFSQPVWRAGQRIALDAPQLDGTPPFPDDRP